MSSLVLAIAFTLTPQSSGTTVRLQAVSVVDDDVAWASGLDGTFVRTTDGGVHWRAGVVKGAEAFQFRDVHAVDADTAYLLSAGTGDASRIYKTTDGGASWTEQFVNDEPKGFFDCFDFWDAHHGLAFSDAVGGKLLVVRTTDGERWERVDSARLPDARPGEGGFAASGTCLTVLGERTAFIGTGVRSARVYRTNDRGSSWQIFDVPVPSGNDTSGVTTLAFRSDGLGFAAGGDVGAPDVRADNVAMTEDFGESWRVTAAPTFSGAVYGLGLVLGTRTPILVAVGPGGASYSVDRGSSWTALSGESFWAVAFSRTGMGLMVGPDGRIVRVDVEF